MWHRAQRGFTLVELMVGIAVLAILVMAAAPSLQAWLVNTRVRTAAEALQNGLRLAQTEAARQSRQVVFSLTNATPALNAVTAPNGRNWSVQIVPIATLDNDVARAVAREFFIRGGPLADTTSGITITGSDNSQAVCFSSTGVLVRNPQPAPAATGAVCTGGAVTYAVSVPPPVPSGVRPLTVQVSLNGRVRMCDPAKALSATNPDGCQ